MTWARLPYMCRPWVSKIFSPPAAPLSHGLLAMPGDPGAALASGATSLRAIASALNDRGIPTARGGKWFAASVRDVLARI
jgi:hypothetical protein